MFDRSARLYLQHLQAKNSSPRTVEFYEDQFRALRLWADKTGTSLDAPVPDADTIEEFLADELQCHKPRTVHARYRALSALCNWLEKRRKIRHDENPISLIDPPNVPDTQRRHVSLEHFNALTAAISIDSWLGLRDRCLLQLMYWSGLRVGEMCALTVADVDIDRLEVTVRQGKRGKWRLVPCHPDVRLSLSLYMLARPVQSPSLWIGSDGYIGSTGQLTVEGVRQMLKRRTAAAGLEYFNPHAYRHGFAIFMANEGDVPMATVQEMMGHADMATTRKIYARTLTRTVRKHYDKALSRAE